MTGHLLRMPRLLWKSARYGGHFGRMVSFNPDMKACSFRIWLILVVLAGVGSCWRVQAQTAAGPDPGSGDTHGLTVEVIHPRETPSPFPLDARTGRGQARQALEFLLPEQMSEADRELADASQAEITRRAGLQGFDLRNDGKGQGSWGYEQAVCPVFPQHVILEYSRNNGPGDVTLFSAVIPRGDGHVRVIPVRRRSYSLFTPAPSNALTLNDFNHMVLEGHDGLSPDWLTLGLCYAALAGGHVRAALLAQTPGAEVYPLLAPATLIVSAKGGAEVRFGDETPHTEAMQWTLTFAQNGHLLKVRHTSSRELVEWPVPGNAAEVNGAPVKGQVVDPGQTLNKPNN
jgi:hypothetical protein